MKIVKIMLGLVVVGSLGLNVLLGVAFMQEQQKNKKLHESVRLNASVVTFANLFIDKVLRATSEISFEDRLKIENAVRDTQDTEIYDQWQKFVNSQSVAEGQDAVKNLLQLVVNKIST